MFLLPYSPAVLLYSLNLSSLLEELDLNGIIKEPDVHGYVLDLANVSLTQTILFFCAVPCVFCIQFCDLLSAVHRSYMSYYNNNRNIKQYQIDKKKLKKKNATVKKKKNFLRRIYKTLTKWSKRPK